MIPKIIIINLSISFLVQNRGQAVEGDPRVLVKVQHLGQKAQDFLVVVHVVKHVDVVVNFVLADDFFSPIVKNGEILVEDVTKGRDA